MSIYLHSSTRKTPQAPPPQEAPEAPQEPAAAAIVKKVNIFRKLLNKTKRLLGKSRRST